LALASDRSSSIAAEMRFARYYICQNVSKCDSALSCSASKIFVNLGITAIFEQQNAGHTEKINRVINLYFEGLAYDLLDFFFL
jgi:hypothetical protein